MPTKFANIHSVYSMTVLASHKIYIKIEMIAEPSKKKPNKILWLKWCVLCIVDWFESIMPNVAKFFWTNWNSFILNRREREWEKIKQYSNLKLSSSLSFSDIIATVTIFWNNFRDLLRKKKASNRFTRPSYRHVFIIFFHPKFIRRNKIKWNPKCFCRIVIMSKVGL